MKTIICIVGKTGTGKDTIAKYIKEKHGIGMVCSYTTRPQRACEENGREHYFISKVKMAAICAKEHVIAYTINDKTGIEYCATAESITDKNIVYIINPNGITYLKEHLPEDFKLAILYCNLSEDKIEERVVGRGDDLEIFKLRLASERDEFDTFYNNKEYDVAIDTSKSLEDVYKQVDAFLAEQL